MGSRTQLTMTPADILKYQNDLVRTGKYISLGRMQKIAIGPTAGYVPPATDPYIRKFGRLIDLRDQFLPIAQSPDRGMLLVPAPLVNRFTNRVQLPDVPDPDWTPAPIAREEFEGQEITLTFAEDRLRECEQKGDLRAAAQWRAARDNIKAGHPVRMPYDRPVEKDRPHMIPQRLEDRTNELLAGTNFLVFSPVLSVTFQPELEKRLVADAWIITFGHNPSDRTDASLLIDRQTGETHFFGGLYDISGPRGDQ